MSTLMSLKVQTYWHSFRCNINIILKIILFSHTCMFQYVTIMYAMGYVDANIQI